MNKSCTSTSPHSQYPPLVHILLIPEQKSPLGTQSGELSQGWVPVLHANKSKAQKTWDEMKSVVSKNFQATLFAMQDLSMYRETVSTVGASTTLTILTMGLLL